MGLLPGGDSGVSRLTINAHKLPDCSDKPNDKTGVFIVQVNPKQVQYKFGVNSPEDSASGNSAQPTGFTGYNKIEMTFDFKADATGIVPVDSTIDEAEFENGGKPSIRGHLNKLQNVVYGYEPEIHGPPFLSFVWGIFSQILPMPKTKQGQFLKVNSVIVVLRLLCLVLQESQLRQTLN